MNLYQLSSRLAAAHHTSLTPPLLMIWNRLCQSINENNNNDELYWHADIKFIIPLRLIHKTKFSDVNDYLQSHKNHISSCYPVFALSSSPFIVVAIQLYLCFFFSCALFLHKTYMDVVWWCIISRFMVFRLESVRNVSFDGVILFYWSYLIVIAMHVKRLA